MHIHFETLGCRLNQIESESAAHSFSEAGFSVDMENTTASSSVVENTILCVINTCTVTTKAEQKARRLIRLLLKKYPNAAIVVTGCYAQVEPEQISALDDKVAVLPGLKKDRLADIPKIVLDFTQIHKDNNNFFDAKLLAKELTEKLFVQSAKEDSNKKISNQITKNSTFVGFPENPFRLSTDTFLTHSRSSLKIQDGCNCQCTYCRIHIARGNSVSLDAAKVLERVLELQKAGQKEVVITTVNIGQYRSEYEGKKIDFTGLLEVLLNNTQNIAFRLSSLYPEIVDERFANLIKDDRVRPHFHISIQSGSSRILQLMKRPYEISQVYKAIDLLKAAKKDPFLACDIIAGFPGETDEDFAQTIKLCKYANFTWIHAFPFSPRPGTEAYSMKNPVPQSVAGKRVDELLSLACANKIAYIESLKGKVLEGIAESVHNSVLKKTTEVRAVSDNFLHCIVNVENSSFIPRPGEKIQLRIVSPLSEDIKNGKETEALATLVI